MISTAHARLMARYNRRQNESLFREADRSSEEERRRDRGAFFGSIHRTLSHLLWADMTWMNRFAGLPKPPGAGGQASADAFQDWRDLAARRVAFDVTIMDWTDSLEAAWLEAETTWLSGSTGREMSRPNWFLATHFFNHQTHHRGQVHAMLTAAGRTPDATDLMLLDLDQSTMSTTRPA